MILDRICLIENSSFKEKHIVVIFFKSNLKKDIVNFAKITMKGMFMVITRFAPSPTGHLHIGGLRTALYNYLHARQHGIDSKFLLRIEDTDTQRNSEEALNGILEALQWSALQYDMPLLYQSSRTEIYKEYVNKLLQSGHAYKCYLTKEELQSERDKNNGYLPPSFSRKYRDYEGSKDMPYSIRLKTPLDEDIVLRDGIKGEIVFSTNDIDDFVILREDGMPTYNFVVAIDDALSNITDVIRGDDHISNTPKQIIIYKALGFDVPRFYHIPMICNSAGKKLSKRDGAVSVLDYREKGILPEALLNFLFRLGFSYKDQEIFTLQEMLECFNINDVNSKPSSCNFEKLYWINAEHIKKLDNASLLHVMNMPHLLDTHGIAVLLDSLKVRVNNLVDFKLELESILNPPSNYDLSVLKKPEMLEYLESFGSEINGYNPSSDAECKEYIERFCTSNNLKAGAFMPVLRIALLGKKGGIDIGACVYILGSKESADRIAKFISHCKTINP